MEVLLRNHEASLLLGFLDCVFHASPVHLLHGLLPTNAQWRGVPADLGLWECELVGFLFVVSLKGHQTYTLANID